MYEWCYSNIGTIHVSMRAYSITLITPTPGMDSEQNSLLLKNSQNSALYA